MSNKQNLDFHDWFTEGPKFFEIDPASSALLVIDMQYGDAHPDYGLGKRIKLKNPGIGRYYFDRIEKIVIPNISRLLDFFREKKMQIIYTTFGPELPDGEDLYPLGRTEDILNERKWGIKTFGVKGSIERTIRKEISPSLDDLVINKTSSGAFNSSNIDAVLRNMKIWSLAVKVRLRVTGGKKWLLKLMGSLILREPWLLFGERRPTGFPFLRFSSKTNTSLICWEDKPAIL